MTPPAETEASPRLGPRARFKCIACEKSFASLGALYRHLKTAHQASSLHLRRKYGNQPVTVDGRTWGSGDEYERWCELKLLERAGEIEQLVYHPIFSLWVNDHHICKYEADASYLQLGYSGKVRTKEMVVEDVKSPATRKNPTYRLKVKLMLACLGIKVKEVV